MGVFGTRTNLKIHGKMQLNDRANIVILHNIIYSK